MTDVLCTESLDSLKSFTPSAKRCRASVITTQTCSQRWCVPDNGPGMDPSATFEAFVRARPLPPPLLPSLLPPLLPPLLLWTTSAKKRLLQVNQMIKQPKPVLLALMVALTSALSLSARAEATARADNESAEVTATISAGKMDFG